ncbi:MAG: T9SS type A sorting domain-containing protein [Bacteroidia bacterium]|nr:T9SS type A sorting domain-containing protein [Bacteroidia bacterium]
MKPRLSLALFLFCIINASAQKEATIWMNEITITSVDIELFDNSGISQLQTTENVNTSNPNIISLNTSVLPSGLYTCIISTGGNLLKCIYLIKS